MNRKSTIVVFIGCLLILTNFSVVASAVTVSTSINKNQTNPVEKIDLKSIKNDNIISPETYKVVPTTQEKSTPTLEENIVTTTQQNEKEILTKAAPESVGYTVQSGNQQIPGGQQNVFLAKANAGGPYSGEIGEEITFSGLSCYLTPGTTFAWDFGDNNDQTAGSGRHPTHTYSANGIYYVTLKVTKSNGETYLDIAPVYIGQQGNNLVPLGGCNYQGQVNQEITFDASNSIGTYPLKYRWDFGDGEGYTAWSYSPLATHTYKKERVYQVKLEIKDYYGDTRIDVLHADIGCTFSSFKNLFLNTDGILDDVISLLFDNQALGPIFCQWLQVKIYYKYNDNDGQTIDINNLNPQNFPKVLDVNDDGGNDVSIGGINILSYTGYRPSAFDPTVNSLQFDSSISGITLLPGGCIGIDDDLILCVQFTFPPFITGLYNTLGINLDPTVRIGVEFEAGKEKPAEGEQVRVTSYFRPFLIECLQGILSFDNSQSQDNNQYPNQQNSNEMILNTQTNTYQYTTTYVPNYGAVVQEITQDTDLNVDSGDLQINAQQTQPIAPEGLSDIYPEHGITIDGINGKSISIIIMASTTGGYSITFKTAFDSLFTPFVVTHRRAETLRDVDISGSDTSAVTFSITAESSDGSSATIGMIINPAQPLGLHVNIDRTIAPKHILLNIDNPPDNVILFTETENELGEENSHYFYMKNIPNFIDLSWTPSFDNGYISLTRGESENFEIGICDDFENPNTKLFLTNIPETIEVSWQLILEEIKSITLSSNVSGLTLNAELKDFSQENQILHFRATTQTNIEIKFEWNIPSGYFSIDKSVTMINFDFTLIQEDLNLNIIGDYTGAEGEGLKFIFNSLKNGIIEVDSGRILDLQISVDRPESEISMKTGLRFEQRGNMILEWDQQLSYITMDSSNSLKFTNFELIAPRLSIAADEVKLTGDAYFNLNLQQEYNFNLGGTNQIILTNFEANVQKWSGSIGYAKSFGNFDINLKPHNKKYEFNMTSSLQLDTFNLMYDDSNPEYDTEFSIDAFVLDAGGSIWFDFGSSTPKFNIQDSYQLSLDDLHFAIGSTVDFSITSFTTSGAGQIYTELNNQHLYVFTNVAFNWDIDIQTLNYGHWLIEGSYSGCGAMTLTEWTPGQSGQVAFSVITPLNHNLRIVRNDIVIDLGTLNLNSGTATIKWQREQSTENGFFNLTNTGIAGSLTLLKINFTNSQNPFEFETGDIAIQPGTLYMDWQKQTNIKMLHINNGLTINLALVKLKWGDKTITIGDISLNPGQFKIVYDTLNKTITLKNGMNAFGPLCTYEDADRKLSVDLLNLINDYSKTMTLKWYEDASNKIVGLYLDTDKVNLVDWIVFESIKYDPNGATGRRIALGGFQADDFKIMKNANDKLEISGYLYIANHITYSRLVNLSNDVWEDLDLQWDLTSSLKWIKFESDFDVSIILLSLDLFGIQFTSEFDLTNYLEVKWSLSGDASQYKEFYFDTNGQVLSSVNFIILGPNNRGIEVVGGGIWAEDFYVKWKLWPPLQADIIVGGTIGYETVTVYGTIDGNTWIEIWPFASGSEHD